MIKLKKVIGFIGLLLTVAIFAIAIFSLFNREFFRQNIEIGLLYYGLFGVLLFSFLLDLFPQSFSAHAVILIAAVLGMNMLNVVLVVIAGAFLASIFGFWLGRTVEEEFFEEIVGKKIYKKIEEYMEKWGKWYVTISAISPLPYIPIVFGALNMDWKKFFIYGIMPRALGFIVTGVFVYYFVGLFASWI